MSHSLFTSKVQFGLYRISTVFKSFKTLYSLPKEKVDAFIDSYSIYDFDWAKEEELIQKMGIGYYDEVKKKVVDWYSVLNHLCSIGQIEKMYIPPAMDLSKSIMANQNLFEIKLSQDLGLKKESKALDIGCGRGRVAHHIAKATGAGITGINIDPDQLESARKFSQSKGMSNRCQFKLGDLNDHPLPFPSHSFDAVYHIQAFSLCKQPLELFKEIYRVLKPMGKFGCLDWARLKEYDPSNPHHASLMKRIKPLIGAIGTLSTEEYADLLKNAGFEVLTNENASIDGLQAPLIESADQFFTRVAFIIKWLVRCKVLPAHFQLLFDRLSQDGEALIEADRMRLVTTSHYIIAQKNS